MTDVSARIFVETCCCSLDPVNDDIPSAVGNSTRKSPIPQISLDPPKKKGFPGICIPLLRMYVVEAI